MSMWKTKREETGFFIHEFGPFQVIVGLFQKSYLKS